MHSKQFTPYMAQRYRGLSFKFGLPVAVCLLVIQFAAAFFINQSQ